jgi:type II secretory pathway pseudopilin PulG
LVVSLGILSALCVLIAQWLVVASAQQAREQEQRLAVQTATNLMEQLFAEPWDRLTQEDCDAIAARMADSSESGLQCTVEITAAKPAPSGLVCKRIHVRVAHRAASFPPAELMAWRHAREDAS